MSTFYQQAETTTLGNEPVLTQEDFLLVCSAESSDVLAALVAPFLELLVEVCHIVLGLRPQCTHQERDIGETI
jgi:hypothetical protein